MISLDSHAVSRPFGLVLCPFRDRDVEVATCVECPRLIRAEPDRLEPERIVCDGRYLAGAMGLDPE